ncbi:hypothetical protein N7495_001411 [Penicillium taxi]|uniref:uncharacterized protein n=1 Tax=Penicillium taxi TaxID=168475 RepID=UPI0025457349|nr:uncharacterized protein N7495_001411 [Penicillium taxi]KAJ5908729.1 hypothetical protein N7495_001411 [Penicillium taxi]
MTTASDSHDSKVLSVILCNGCLIIASTLALFVRLFVRMKYLTGIQLDDVFCVVGWVRCFQERSMTGYGYGKHIDTIHSEKELEIFLKLDFATELMYLHALCAIKISFCLFYLKIFPGNRFRIIVWCILGLVISETAEETFVVIFQCWPIRKAWDPTEKEGGKCLPLLAFFYISFAARLVTDLALFTLPVPQLIRLKMTFVKRAGLLWQASSGRLILIDFSRIAHNLVETLNWSSAELELAVFISCFPSFKALVSFRYPGLRRKLGLSAEHSYGASYELYNSNPDEDHSRGLFHSSESKKAGAIFGTHIEVGASQNGSEEPNLPCQRM